MRPLEHLDGYLPLEDHGLIGDGETAALVGRDGAVSWLCLPRFDSPPVFCAILDRNRGGAFTVAPEELLESEQSYVGDTGVLHTRMRARNGTLELTDALLLQPSTDLREDRAAGRQELWRSVRVLEGFVDLHVTIRPRGQVVAVERAGGLQLKLSSRPQLDLQVWSSRPLSGIQTVLRLHAGETLELVLHWGGRTRHQLDPLAPELLTRTIAAWQRWSQQVVFDGPEKRHVRRSAITLKMLDHLESGALIAAPTSSLPEVIGGIRNWDYRYAWVRDAAFSSYAFTRIGMAHEAYQFLAWVLEAVERHGRPSVLYTLDGLAFTPELEDPELEGYRRSRPVRWGNGAAAQRQHDVFGEIIDCAWQWAKTGQPMDEKLWTRLVALAERARREWHTVDQGIWEVRSAGRPFTYSAALCHVALNRAARMSERFGLPGDVVGWRRDAKTIRDAILEQAWDERMGSLTAAFGGGGLDASLLALPLRQVLEAEHPKMRATVETVARELSAGGGLLFRYLIEELDDGLTGHEGAFVLCSFWLVDNLVLQGRLDEAEELFASLCARSRPLGLLPEQIDPSTGHFLGNFPQAFSHVGLISSAVNLERARAAMTAATSAHRPAP